MATTKAAPKKTPTKKVNNSVVVLETATGEPLVIRANPTDEAVRGYVQEQTRRYIAGEPGGPSGISPFRIFNAKRYASEPAWLASEDATAEIDISDLLPS